MQQSRERKAPNVRHASEKRGKRRYITNDINEIKKLPVKWSSTPRGKGAKSMESLLSIPISPSHNI